MATTIIGHLYIRYQDPQENSGKAWRKNLKRYLYDHFCFGLIFLPCDNPGLPIPADAQWLLSVLTGEAKGSQRKVKFILA